MTYISYHVIQTYPYSNMNRDGEGAVKSVSYGGANRTRISSQSYKRAMRLYAESTGSMEPSIRTREIEALLLERLKTSDTLAEEHRENAAAIVGGGVAELSGATKKKQVLAFWSASEIADLVSLAETLTDAGGMKAKELDSKRKELSQQIEGIVAGAEHAVALFGRMFADQAALTVDGAAQVAHAFTVHQTNAELDYFTAVEDWKTVTDDSGAGHLGTAEFSAGTFYRYANLGINELLHNVGGDVAAAKDLVRAFTQAFALSVPSGKGTSTAPRTNPDLIYVAVEQQPTSLASAFDEPVKSRTGFREPAAKRLSDEAKAVHSFLGSPPAQAAHSTVLSGIDLDGLGDNATALNDLVAIAGTAVETAAR